MKKSIAYLVFAGSLALGLSMAETVTQDTAQNKKTEQVVQAPDFRTIEQPLDEAIGASPKSDSHSRKQPDPPVILIAPTGGCMGCRFPDWLQALLSWLPV